MCGICAYAFFVNESGDTSSCHFKSLTYQELIAKLKRRGPDNFSETHTVYKHTIDLSFCSSVLHLRGSTVAVQPFRDDLGNVLLWNGEIFDDSLVGFENESDTKILAQELFNCMMPADVLNVIKCIEGPYAFIFFQASGYLWFGRDIFGRRSLLWNFENSSLQLCSVSDGKTNWKEVPTEGIFCVDINETVGKELFVIYQYPWSSSASGIPLNNFLSETQCTNISLKIEPNLFVQNPVVEALNMLLPTDTASGDLLMLMKSLQEKKDSQELLHKILDIPIWCQTVNKFEDVLSDAVKKRTQYQLHFCKNCYSLSLNKTNVNCNHASMGILFSGGLDSIVLACLSNRHLSERKPIDLINVAFASSISLKGSKDYHGHLAFETPDRISGRNGFIALQNILPCRKWNFIEINVAEEDLIAGRKESICSLLNPSLTVLDDSIGCALWFASCGKGSVYSSEGYHAYTSPAKVLLLGMGADEQLAGYSRHRAKFKAAGWSGLIEELSLELDRIGSRNLGRDDRIISDNGVESRYPFLDEKVVSFLNKLPVWLKANLNFPRGIGEKLLLRLLAFKLGLTEAAVLPKRAIQFGSRIARIENSKEKGSDICERLMNL